MKDVIINVSDFRKHYCGVTALDGISFDVYRGEIFGLLGPNGAGKTTTLESLEGLRTPDGGSLRVMGADSGFDFHGARLGYYVADGDPFLWGNDYCDTDYARCAGFVLLD